MQDVAIGEGGIQKGAGPASLHFLPLYWPFNELSASEAGVVSGLCASWYSP
jgi:hypothetical protein